MVEYTLSSERVIVGLRSGLSPSGWLWKPLDRVVPELKGAVTGLFAGGVVTLLAALFLLLSAAFGAALGELDGAEGQWPVLAVPIACMVAVACTTVAVQRRRRRRQRALARHAQPVVTLLERAIDVLALDRNSRVIVDRDSLHVAMWSTVGLWFAATVSTTGQQARLELSLPGQLAELRKRPWPHGAELTNSHDADHTNLTLSLDALTDDVLHDLGRQLVAVLRDVAGEASGEAVREQGRGPVDVPLTFVAATPVVTADPSPAGGARVERTAPARVLHLRRLATSWVRGARLCAFGVSAQLALALLMVPLALMTATSRHGEWVLAAAAGTLLVWGVICWTLMFDLHLAAPPAPRVVPEPPLELVVDEGSTRLRHGHREVVLDEPFDVVLTRAPGSTDELGVEVRQRQGAAATARATAVRWTVAGRLDPDIALEGLPLWQASAPRVPAHDLSQWLWPTLAFYSAVHGRPLPVSVELESSGGP